MKKILLAVAALVVVAAIAIVAVVTLGGEDEKTVRGTCGSTAYQLSVDEEDGGLEAAFELQSSAPGETWTVLVEQGDSKLLEGERQTDEDAELDLDVPAQSDGDDTFTVTATPESGEPCVATLTR